MLCLFSLKKKVDERIKKKMEGREEKKTTKNYKERVYLREKKINITIYKEIKKRV